MPVTFVIKDVTKISSGDFSVSCEVWIDGKQESSLYYLHKGDSLDIRVLEEDKIRILAGVKLEDIGLGLGDCIIE